MQIYTFWTIISSWVAVEVHCRSWKAIVDSSIYESSNKDIARVLNATEDDLFPMQTAMPTIIFNPSPSPSRFAHDQTSQLPTSLAPFSPAATKQPNQVPTASPWIHNTTSILPTRVPQLAPWQPKPNSLLAPTTVYDMQGNFSCKGNASVYRVVVSDMEGSTGSNMTLSITYLTFSTKIVSQRLPVPRSNMNNNQSATSNPTSNTANVLHRPTSSNIFGRPTLDPPSPSNGSVHSNPTGHGGNISLVNERNITVGVAKRHIVGNFTFHGSNNTESAQYVCLERQICYDVLVQGGSEGIRWAVVPLKMGVPGSTSKLPSSTAAGNGGQGFHCTFHTINSQILNPPCLNSCNTTRLNSTSADSSIRPTTPAMSFQPTRTLLPSRSMYPSFSGAGHTPQPGSLSQLPTHFTSTTVGATSPSGRESVSPSTIPTSLAPTRTHSQQRHLTHYPTDFTEIGPPVEAKTPFPTFQGV